MRRVFLSLFVWLLQLWFNPTNEQDIPIALAPIAVASGTGACPNASVLTNLNTKIKNALANLTLGRPGDCGGSSWIRIAYLNMTDSNQTCPSNWTFVNYTGNGGVTLRACQRKNQASCDTAYYSVNGRRYTEICGRIVANVFGQPEAFSNYPGQGTINTYYFDGMDITRGNPRQQVWSFPAATSRMNSVSNLCPCSNRSLSIPSSNVPPFVGSNYFCDCGAPPYKSDNPGVHYYNHTLWSGKDCPPDSTCCSFNKPPWFWRVLGNSTTDDIEVRQCANNVVTDENIDAIIVEVYIR